DDAGPLTGKQWLSLSIVGLALGGWISKPLHHVGEAWIAFAALLAFLATGVLDKKTFRTRVDWPIIMFFGVVYSMGGICS
ncbi:MAG: hypothetical protein GTO40_04800, partial [Deltaproteobacteria bacterium]|nr:hypothetical protein [Deltaproteobacteria bacterium]